MAAGMKDSRDSLEPNVDSPSGRPLVSVPRVATVVGTSAGTPPVVVLRPVTASPGIATITSSGTTGTIRITPLPSQSIKLASSSPIVRSAVPNSTIRPILLHPPVPKPEPSPSPDVQAHPVKQEPASVTPSVTATGSQRNVIREMQVRVPNRKDKRFSVLRFHAVDHPDLSSGIEVFMQRENNLKLFRAAHNISDAPERGAGSEFGREMKEEARLKKYGIVRENYRPDDQPWLMTVGKGKTGRRRFRGVREGSVSENVEYFVFCQCKDGNFDAYPIHAWYKMKPEINYRFLRGDEAEIEYSRLHKTMNLFNVMIKRKLADGEMEDDTTGSTNRDKELGKELRYLSVATENKLRTEKDSGLGVTESKTNPRRSNRALKLTDLEELESTSDLEEEEDDADGEADADGQLGGVSEGAKPGSSNLKSNSLDSSKSSAVSKSQIEKARLLKKKQRDAALVARMRRCARIRKARKRQLVGSSSEEDDPLDEARDDSEVDDREGDEVDYMTNSSSDEEKLSTEERERIYEETGVDEEAGLKALLTDISSDGETNVSDAHKVDSEIDDIPEDSVTGDASDMVRKRPVGVQDQSDGAGQKFESPGHRLGEELGRKLHGDSRLRALNEDGTQPSSSSSSSVDGDSSSCSSSSSDSDVDFEAKLKQASKRSAIMQKLSDSIKAGVSASGGATPGSLKRRATELGDASLSSPTFSLPSNKKGRVDAPPVTTASSSTAPSATPSTSTATDSELMSTVRKYLMRKPITVTELLKKIRLRKLVGKNEDAQTALANVLRQLRPIKQIINGQHALSLKH